MPRKTTEKGLGWRHQQAVEYLRTHHKDGSPCDQCGRPLWLDPTKNYDYDPHKRVRGNGVLQGDHSKMSRAEALRRGEKVLPPDRLLHAECNRMRGAGLNDHLAAANRGTADTHDDTLAMAWPWRQQGE